MPNKSVLINDPRIPGGSAEEIKNDYNLEVEFHGDGAFKAFKVSGETKDVDDYIRDYSIIVSE